ncbi:MAG: hypothetical protein AABX53_00625 [Nanoarchaeota archaeon]
MKERKAFVMHDEKETRKALESGKIRVISDLESSRRADKVKHLESGLTPVLARIAADKKVAIGWNLETLKKKKKHERAVVLARMRQNIKLARKAGASLAIRGDAQEGAYLLLSLGASTKQVRDLRTQSF